VRGDEIVRRQDLSRIDLDAEEISRQPRVVLVQVVCNPAESVNRQEYSAPTALFF
jgi:hypothetical protein